MLSCNITAGHGQCVIITDDGKESKGQMVSCGNRVALEFIQVRDLSDSSLVRAKSSLSTCVSSMIPKGTLFGGGEQALEG